MISIALADDHAMVRDALVRTLEDDPGLSVVGQFGSGEELLRRLNGESLPSVAVVDVSLPGDDGLRVCAQLHRRQPRVRTVLITGLTPAATDLALIDSFTAGARGFVLKDSDPVVLRLAVRSAANGGYFVDPKLTGRVVTLMLKGERAHGPRGVTVAEQRVLRLVHGGCTNREISQQLHVSENTVKSHVRSLLHKLDAADRVEAAVIAEREGLA